MNTHRRTRPQRGRGHPRAWSGRRVHREGASARGDTRNPSFCLQQDITSAQISKISQALKSCTLVASCSYFGTAHAGDPSTGGCDQFLNRKYALQTCGMSPPRAWWTARQNCKERTQARRPVSLVRSRWLLKMPERRRSGSPSATTPAAASVVNVAVEQRGDGHSLLVKLSLAVPAKAHVVAVGEIRTRQGAQVDPRCV